MRKIEALYSGLLVLLKEFTIEGESFVTYYDKLTDTSQGNLLVDSEKITAQIGEINNAINKEEFFTDFVSLGNALTNFTSDHPDFPDKKANEIYATISIIQKLTNELSSIEDYDLTEDIDTTIFSLVNLRNPVVQDNFMHYDAVNIDNSIFLFDISKIAEFSTYITSSTNGKELLFYLTALLGQPNVLPDKAKYVLVKKELETKPVKVWAILSIHILRDGKHIHSPYEYSNQPSITSNCQIDFSKDYQQFNDSIYIISEYNQQNDILDKYLRIYHVLENFMYKSQLVKLEKNANGQVFSIRDFQRMFDAISGSELQMLKKLFLAIMDLEYTPLITFKTQIFTKWAELQSIHLITEPDLNNLLRLLNIRNSNNQYVVVNSVRENDFPSFLPNLIYSFRNSIVHNRETEFHLTHFTLLSHPTINDTARKVLEYFLLPSVEELVFNLIIKKNDITWYDNPTLTLWIEN